MCITQLTSAVAVQSLAFVQWGNDILKSYFDRRLNYITKYTCLAADTKPCSRFLFVMMEREIKRATDIPVKYWDEAMVARSLLEQYVANLINTYTLLTGNIYYFPFNVSQLHTEL